MIKLILILVSLAILTVDLKGIKSWIEKFGYMNWDSPWDDLMIIFLSLAGNVIWFSFAWMLWDQKFILEVSK
jgi:hypothetical protein